MEAAIEIGAFVVRLELDAIDDEDHRPVDSTR